MQKHQEWLENKQYQYHLDCLTKIKTKQPNIYSLAKHLRSKNVKSAINHRKRQTNKENRISDAQQVLRVSEFPVQATFHVPSRMTKDDKISKNSPRASKQKSTISLKDKQILLNNFLLGKRIIQTPSVINFKKNELSYRKQKKLLDSRNEKFKQSIQNNTFREQKLKEYSFNNTAVNKKFRLKTSNRYQRFHRIVRVCLGEFRHLKGTGVTQRYFPVKDFYLKMRYSSQFQAKGQNSEIVNTAILQNYCFYFGYNSKHFYKLSQNGRKSEKGDHSPLSDHRQIYFDIFEAKGIEITYFGTFMIDISGIQTGEPSRQFSVSVERLSKKICEVDGRISIQRKSNILESR